MYCISTWHSLIKCVTRRIIVTGNLTQLQVESAISLALLMNTRLVNL